MEHNQYFIEEGKLQKAKDKVKINTKRRQKERANKLQDTINLHGKMSHYNWPSFEIENTEQLTDNVIKTLESWPGGKYKKEQKTDKDCFDKARNYWCREKAKPLGTEFIYPVLKQLFNHIITNMDGDINLKHKLLLYFQILKPVLNIDIKFKRTSTKPLVLHAMYFKPNRFKEYCKMIIEVFNFDDTNIEWKLPRVTESVRNEGDRRATSRYIRDDSRAQKLHDSFIHCIDRIIHRIQQCNDINVIIGKVSEFMENMGMEWGQHNHSQDGNMDDMDDMNERKEEDQRQTVVHIQPPAIPPIPVFTAPPSRGNTTGYSNNQPQYPVIRQPNTTNPVNNNGYGPHSMYRNNIGHNYGNDNHNESYPVYRQVHPTQQWRMDQRHRYGLDQNSPNQRRYNDMRQPYYVQCCCEHHSRPPYPQIRYAPYPQRHNHYQPQQSLQPQPDANWMMDIDNRYEGESLMIARVVEPSRPPSPNESMNASTYTPEQNTQTRSNDAMLRMSPANFVMDNSMMNNVLNSTQISQQRTASFRDESSYQQLAPDDNNNGSLQLHSNFFLN